MQYWKQAAKQQQHNNDCPNSFYYNITLQLVCSHVNTSSRLMTISFPWQLVDVFMLPWKASSPLRDCSTISWKQAVGLELPPGFVCPSHLRAPFSCVSLLSYKCVYRHSQGCMPGSWLNSQLNSSVSEIGRDFWGLAGAIVPLRQNLRRFRCITTETTGLEKILSFSYDLTERKSSPFALHQAWKAKKTLNVFPFIGFKGERRCCNYLAFLPQCNASCGAPFSSSSCLPL